MPEFLNNAQYNFQTTGCTIVLCRFDDRHRIGKGLTTGVTASKKPVLPSDSNRAHRPLSHIVVNRHTPLLKEERE